MKIDGVVVPSGTFFQHVENSDIYMYTETCQIKIGNDWFDGVIYRRNGKNYVRTVENFKDCFKLVAPIDVKRQNENFSTGT